MLWTAATQVATYAATHARHTVKTVLPYKRNAFSKTWNPSVIATVMDYLEKQSD
jgi:hypothetical protein